MYIGHYGFHVCTHCSRMHINEKCPNCGQPGALHREFRDTTSKERERWEAGKYFADPSKEPVGDG